LFHAGNARRAVKRNAEFHNGLVEITVKGGVAGVEPTRIPLKDRSSEPVSRSLG
jgi:hypothetical protein